MWVEYFNFLWVDYFNNILADNTGKTVKMIEKDTNRDNFMSAKEAVSYGIIDEIVTQK